MQQMTGTGIAVAFRSCVGPAGVADEVGKLALDRVPDPARMEYVELSDRDIVADGFDHAFLVDRRLGMAYIEETGGLAGVRKWYGPLTLRARCTAGRCVADRSSNADIQQHCAASRVREHESRGAMSLRPGQLRR